MSRYISILLSMALATTVFAQTPAQLAVAADSSLPRDLAWQSNDCRYAHAMTTRAGEVTVRYIGQEDTPSYKIEILFNGVQVAPPFPTDGDFGIVSLCTVFKLAGQDVMLIQATAGGSGSPPPQLLLLTVEAAGKTEPRLLLDPQLRSADGMQRVATDNTRLYFDLGYEGGRYKTATYEAGRITVKLSAALPVPLEEAACAFLHQALEYCALGQSGLSSTAMAHTLHSLEQRPGFSRQPLVQACAVAQQQRKAPSYEEFKQAVCSSR